jgi:hypothetical protein
MTDADDGDKNYAFYEAMNETLDTVIKQVEQARNANPPQLGWRLKMVRHAINCAIEIYGDHVCAIDIYDDHVKKGKK